jgi:thymidine kinase
MDYLGNPFGPMPEILVIAEMIDKQKAVCFICGKAASMTFRIKGNDKLIEVGDKSYEARCRKCHFNNLNNL